MPTCYSCRNVRDLESAILQAWIDLMTYSIPAFPQTKDAIIAVADSKFFNVSDGDYFRAYRGYMAIAAEAVDPAFDCKDSTFFQGGEQKRRAEVLGDIITLILTIDAGYDVSWANLTRVACNVCGSQRHIRGCILYCVSEYAISVAPGTTYQDAIQKACCCPGVAGEQGYIGILGVERAPDGFPGPPVGGGSLPTTGLIIQLESDLFDAQANGTALTGWSDQSGNANDFNAASGYEPLVDQVNTINGHASVRHQVISVTRHFRRQSALSGTPGPSLWTAAEVLAIMKKDSDPPVSAGPSDQGAPFKFGSGSNYLSHIPLSSGDVYENFANTTRPNNGNPTTSFANWVGYNVRATKNGTNCDEVIKVGSETLYSGTPGAWQEPEIGTGFSVGSSYAGLIVVPTYQHWSMNGNLAAIYMWSQVLGASDRASLAGYISTKWGVTIPTT